MAIFYTDSASFDRVEVTSSLFVSGTFILSGSLNVSNGGFTGSLLGSASYSNQSLSSSYALTASFIIGGASEVIIQNEGNPQGNAGTLNFVGDGVNATVATGVATITITGGASDFPFTGSAIISGSLQVTGSFFADRDSIINSVTIGRGGGNLPSNMAIGSGSLINNIAAGYKNTAIGYKTLSTNITGCLNTAIGFRALAYNTYGGANVAIGTDALNKNNTGGNNTAVGANSLEDNTSGNSNTAVGSSALTNNTFGGFNTAIGNQSLYKNTTGNRNTAIGTCALTCNNSGIRNVAVGSSALSTNSSGICNTAVGDRALRYNTIGSYNTAIGLSANFLNTSGCRNTAIGVYALRNNLTGERNVTVGYQSGRNILGSNNVVLGGYTGSGDVTSSNNNIFISDGTGSLRLFITGSNGLATFFGTGGVSASAFTGSLLGTASFAVSASWAPGGSGTPTFPFTGSAIISGSLEVTGSFTVDRDATINNVSIGRGAGTLSSASLNVAIGSGSLVSNTTGINNVAVGNSALRNNTFGYSNTAIGSDALRYNTTGARNTAIGHNALRDNTTGFNNTAIGRFALRLNTTGFHNTAIGYGTLRFNTIGKRNTAVGYAALYCNITANANTAVGHFSLLTNTCGSYNTALGYCTLRSNITGLYNVAVGFGALASNSSGQRNISIGIAAGCSITIGNNNVFLGSYTGSAAQATENNNIFISDGQGNLRIFVTGSNGLATFFGTGGVSASAFTGSLLGTASYATQALSASWAPGGSGASDFPYTGSAIISGSLQITGSIFVSNTGSDDVFIKIKNDDASIAGQAALNIRNDLENGIEVGVKTSNYLTLPDGLLDGNDSFIINNGGQLYIGNNSSGNAAAIKFYANPGFPPFFPPDLALTITGSDTIVVNLFATGSLYGTASWATNVVNGATSDPFPYTGSAIISGSLIVTGSARVLGDGNDGFESFGNINDYFEIFAQNRNSGISASSDIVAYNDQGNKTQNYVDMGINSSGISPTYSFGKANDAYVYNTGGDLFIGNSTAFYQPTRPSQSLHLFANGPGRPDLTITGSRIGIQKSGSLNATLDVLGNVMISGALHITGSADAELKVLGESQFTGSIRVTNGIIAQSVTASLQGSASYALTASFALNAGGGSGFPFEGEAVITGSLIILTGSAIFPLLTASEALTAGDFVNITTGGVRKASNDDVTKQAHGFVVQAYSATENVNVYYNGINPIITGLSIGARYFLGTSGGETVTPPTAAGSLSQEVGVAVSSTAILVNFGPGIIT